MQAIPTTRLQEGDQVTLLSKPDGCSTRDLPLTVGKTYEVVHLDGSNVVTTTDVPGETGNYWHGRVQLQV